ncbi:MAG TPA: PorV/PorQ family protein [Bacteroidia bacterium]|nr:PorV/PorQ family protein [Bacteroidia bacterium]
MKKYLGKVTYLLIAFSLLNTITERVFAGNEDRAGSAGATELLINPWARSAGWGGVNIASVKGCESSFLNIAGAAFVKKTEISFTQTKYLKGSEINISALGFSQKVGATGVVTLALMSMSFGDIPITTVDLPEGGLGTYSPQFINLGLSYSKEFSNSIYGGITARIISESISDVKASGFAFDAGIIYRTGTNAEKDNLKIGIALKNVGAPLKYSGDGLTFKGNPPGYPYTGNYQMTVLQRSDKFEMPSLVNIGISYDWKLAELHSLTTALLFTSNSFTNDQFGGGLEYTFKKLFSLRGGYVYEKKLSNEEESVTASNGLSGGVTVEVPLGKSGKSLGIDYAYSTTRYFDGTHRVGIRLTL